MQKVLIVFIFPLLIALGPVRICQLGPMDDGTSQVTEYESNHHCHGSSEKNEHESRDNCEHCQSVCCQAFVTEVFEPKAPSSIASQFSINNFGPYSKTIRSYRSENFRPPIFS